MFSLARNQRNTAALATAYSRLSSSLKRVIFHLYPTRARSMCLKKKNLFCRLNISQQKNKLNERGSSALLLKVFA